MSQITPVKGRNPSNFSFAILVFITYYSQVMTSSKKPNASLRAPLEAGRSNPVDPMGLLRRHAYGMAPRNDTIALLLKVFVTVFAAYILVVGCGKEQISIGKGDSEREFQSCLKLSSKGKHEEAIQCMEMFKARYPQTTEGQVAMLKIGDAQFAQKDYLIAAESYLAFLRLYPMHSKADYAHYRAGVSYFKESPKAIDRDQGYLSDAIEQLRIVLSRYPRSEYAELSRMTLNVALKRVAKRQFYIGKFYFRTGQYIAAIPRFKSVADDFPGSGLADRALYMVIKADLSLNRFEDAKAAFGKLSTEYPTSKFVKKAEHKLLQAAKKI